MDSLEPIKRKIYEIRGRRVMLDSDLADMYNVETKNLKRAVRANIERFPDDFMFELTKEEYDSLRCNFFTLNNEGDALRYQNFTSNALRSQIVTFKTPIESGDWEDSACSRSQIATLKVPQVFCKNRACFVCDVA